MNYPSTVIKEGNIYRAFYIDKDGDIITKTSSDGYTWYSEINIKHNNQIYSIDINKMILSIHSKIQCQGLSNILDYLRDRLPEEKYLDFQKQLFERI